MVVLSYDAVVDKLRKSARTRLANNLNSEIMQIRTCPIPSIGDDVIEEDDDIQYSCFQCKQILFNSRRSCNHCKGIFDRPFEFVVTSITGFDLCEACFGNVGKSHPHKMKKYRKTAVQNYLEMIDQVMNVLQDREDLLLKDRELAREETSPIRDVKPTQTQQQLLQQQQQDSRYFFPAIFYPLFF